MLCPLLPSAWDSISRRAGPESTSATISLLLVSAYLERMADHVTNIGERIWYM